jgi:hypothetical protein
MSATTASSGAASPPRPWPIRMLASRSRRCAVSGCAAPNAACVASSAACEVGARRCVGAPRRLLL